MRELYCNPVPFSDGERHTNPDPYILRWCGRYYCYATDEAGVKVSVSEDMVHWEYKGYAISEKAYHHYWAPSVIYINGLFYMYYSNTPVEELDCHEEHLKLAVAKEPCGPFVYRKTFFEKFSIDSHPVMWNGNLYLFYSVNDWIGLEPAVAGTCILVDRMVTPEEFAGEPKAVVLPSLPQEIYEKNRFGDGRDWYTIEGASPVFRGDKCFMLYSANAFENIYYFVGTAVAQIREDLRDMVWKKYPNDYTWMPLLKKNQVVEGTGHNTVTKAPNLFEDWIVYHGRDIEEGLHPGVEERNMRIDPLLYFGDRMFCPGPSYTERPVPGKGVYGSREIEASEKVLLAEAGEFYRAEIWCSAALSHAGAKYMVYPDYEDEKNYIGVKMHSGRRKVSAVCCSGGITTELAELDLPKGYDFGVPHLIHIERKKNVFQVTLDEDRKFVFRAEGASRTGRIGAGGCFTPLTIHSVAVAQGAWLRGRELVYLPEFYNCSGGEIAGGVLRSLEGTFSLSERSGEKAALQNLKDGLYHTEKSDEKAEMQSFQWQVTGCENQADLYCGEEKLCSLTAAGDTLTFYCYREGNRLTGEEDSRRNGRKGDGNNREDAVGNGRLYILTDGKVLDKGIMDVTEVSGISILSGQNANLLCDRQEGAFSLEVKGLSLREYVLMKVNDYSECERFIP